MLRRLTLLLFCVFIAAAAPGSASEQPGRRRLVTNPHFAVEGVVSSVEPGAFRIQGPAGSTELAVGSTTSFSRGGAPVPSSAISPGDYAIVDAMPRISGSPVALSVALFTVPSSETAADTLRVGGTVTGVSPGGLELAMPDNTILPVTANESTVIRRDGALIHLADIAVGSFARVAGKATGDHALLALEIDVMPSQQDARPMVAGDVTAVRPAERAIVVRVHGSTIPAFAPDLLVGVRVDDATKVYRAGALSSFDAFRPGDFVLAFGSLSSDGSLLAARIDVVARPDAPPRVAGRVLAIAAESQQLVVAPEMGWLDDASAPAIVTVVANDATRVERDGLPTTFDTIQPGDFVKVAGSWQGGSLVAEVIDVSSPPTSPSPSILGAIDSIDTAAHAINVRVGAVLPMIADGGGIVKVYVDGNTVIRRSGAAATFESLATGELVRVKGDLRDDGSILATRIDVMAMPAIPDQIAGEVTAVTDRSIDVVARIAFPTFAPVRATVLIGPDTKITRNGVAATIGEIRIGDLAWAVGTRQDARTILARQIKLASKDAIPVVVSGTVTTISGLDLTVTPFDMRMQPGSTSPLPPTPVTVRGNDQTAVYRADVKITFADLRKGDTIAAEGDWVATNVLGARVIRVIPSMPGMP